MSSKPSIPRSNRNPVTEIAFLLGRLESFYTKVQPAESENAFQEKILKSVLLDKTSSGDVLKDQLFSIVNQDDPKAKASPLAPLYISCAYCSEAYQAIEKDDFHMAWTY